MRFALILVAVMCTPCLTKADAVLPISSSGAYGEDGTSVMAGFMTGYNVAGEGRGFLVFDVSTLTGPAATSAAIALDSLYLRTPDLFETIDVFDADASSTVPGGGVAAFDDLGTGTLFGDGVSPPFEGPHTILLTLNGDGVDALNAARAGDGLFRVGLRIDDLTGTPGTREATNGSSASLIVEGLNSPPIVPLPPAAWAGLGLLGTLAGVQWHRRRSALSPSC